MKTLAKILVFLVVLLSISLIVNLFFVQEEKKQEIIETKPIIIEEPIILPLIIEESVVILPGKEEVEIPKPEKVVKEKIPIHEEKEIISVPETRKEIILPIPKIKEVVKEEKVIPAVLKTTKTAEDAWDIEIPGLVTEETMTKVGYEFYENFCIFWEAPKQGIQDYSISIDEKASPSWGSWIQVNVNAKMNPVIVWSNIVKPRSEEVEEAAKKAVEATKDYLNNYGTYQEQLAGEDMSGDGIY